MSLTKIVASVDNMQVWLNNINAAIDGQEWQILRKSKDGTIQSYQASADTDVARATAALSALGDIADYDTFVFNQGTYDFASNLVTLADDKNASFIGLGAVKFTSAGNNVRDFRGFQISNGTTFEDVYIENITFETVTADADYVDGHGYTAVFNGPVTCRNCRFIMDTTITALIDAGSTAGLKNFVNTVDDRCEMVDCIFETYSANAIKIHSTALHSSSAPNVLFDGCYLLGKNLTTDWIGVPTINNCWTNTEIGRGLMLMNRQTANALATGAGFSATEFVQNVEELSPNQYKLHYRSTTAGWQNMFHVHRNSSSRRGYAIEISGVRANASSYYRYFQVQSDGTINDVSAPSENASLFQLSLDTATDRDSFQISVATARGFYGTVRLIPSYFDEASEMKQCTYLEFTDTKD